MELSPQQTSAIFVSERAFLSEQSVGGVQICTREYRDIVEAVGMSALDSDRRIGTRLARRVYASPYLRRIHPASLRELVAVCRATAPQYVFLNQVALAALAPELRAVLPASSRIVVLSHGLESTDFLHMLRLRGRLPLSGRADPHPATLLGQMLLTEAELRRHVDVVITLSPFDADMERWVGAKRVGWIPRLLQPRPVAWRPIGDRVGFLGTLDHAPNLEGLVDVLDALGPSAPRVRVVSGSEATGRWLASRYQCVDYLGPLDDPGVRREAESWSAFIHPIFCQARGCSTKLATALSWEIPVLTTPEGHRGYAWRQGTLWTATDAATFAAACHKILIAAWAEEVRAATIAVGRSGPSLRQNAERLQQLIGHDPL
jgi:Glycosyl transferases group 1